MKNIGSVIDKEFNSACKEQLGKSFGEGMSMVPKAGLTKKVSPVEAKKKSVKKEKILKKCRKFLEKIMMSTFTWLNENLSQPGKGKEW